MTAIDYIKAVHKISGIWMRRKEVKLQEGNYLVEMRHFIVRDGGITYMLLPSLSHDYIDRTTDFLKNPPHPDASRSPPFLPLSPTRLSSIYIHCNPGYNVANALDAQ